MLLQIPLCDRVGIDKDKGGIHHVAWQRGDLMLHEIIANFGENLFFRVG